MKQKSTAESRKIKLQFIDMKVEMEGNQENLCDVAYSILSVMIADRLKFNELSTELHIDEEQEGTEQRKSKRIVFDSMFQ